MDLVTQHLRIRDFKQEDWKDLHTLYLLPETVQFNPSGYPEHEDETRTLVQSWSAQSSSGARSEYTGAITGKDNGTFIGVISLVLASPKYRKAELWYKLVPAHWGMGLATEAVKAMLAFGFQDLSLHRIECGCSTQHVASYRVMEKAGMQREGIKRKNLPLSDGWHDGYLYAILEEEHALLIK